VSRSTVIYGVSIAAHVALAITVGAIRQRERGEIIAISMADSKKKAAEPQKPVEPARVTEPEAKAAQPRPAAAKAKVAPAEPKTDAAPPPPSPANAAAALDALPDFGLTLSSGAGGPGGIALPAGGGRAAAPSAEPQAKTAAPQVQAPRPADECAEPLVKPKPKGVSSPAYTSAAREANIEGKVRIEVTVGASGNVTNARVIAGLGYGLDEAALAAARRATFEPGTRCGKPVTATFVIAMRFSL
jgi:protein TonB